jgi:hypothetical protein
MDYHLSGKPVIRPLGRRGDFRPLTAQSNCEFFRFLTAESARVRRQLVMYLLTVLCLQSGMSAVIGDVLPESYSLPS